MIEIHKKYINWWKEKLNLSNYGLLWITFIKGLIIGILFNVMCMRIGEVSFVVPFRYSIIIFAIIYGMIFYNEIPDLSMILGTVIIILTGIYTLYRERSINIKNN